MAATNPDEDTSLTLMMRVGQSPADNAAWDEFVERYQPMIRAWCLRWGSQASDADDVAQDVLTKLVTAMKTFRYDPARSFRAWLKTVTQNAWTDFAKDQHLRPAADPHRMLAIADCRDALVDLEKEMEEALDRELYELALHRVEKRVKPATWQAFRGTIIDNRPGARRGPRPGHAGRPRLRRQAPRAEDARTGSSVHATNHGIHEINM